MLFRDLWAKPDLEPIIKIRHPHHTHIHTNKLQFDCFGIVRLCLSIHFISSLLSNFSNIFHHISRASSSSWTLKGNCLYDSSCKPGSDCAKNNWIQSKLSIKMTIFDQIRLKQMRNRINQILSVTTKVPGYTNRHKICAENSAQFGEKSRQYLFSEKSANHENKTDLKLIKKRSKSVRFWVYFHQTINRSFSDAYLRQILVLWVYSSDISTTAQWHSQGGEVWTPCVHRGSRMVEHPLPLLSRTDPLEH